MDLAKIERKVNRDKESPWIELLCTEFEREYHTIILNGKKINTNKFGEDAYHRLYNVSKLPIRIQLKDNTGKTIQINVSIDARNKCHLVRARS